LSWQRHARLFLGAATLLLITAVGAAAQETVQPPAASSFSQALRAQGHSLSDAEAAFLDADERLQATYIQALINIDLLSRVDAERRNDDWRQALTSELQRILGQDPSASPSPPSSLEQFRELAIAYRRDVHAAATKWMEAVGANDPEWLQRGPGRRAGGRRRGTLPRPTSFRRTATRSNGWPPSWSPCAP
jgi:hypothetical protein